MFLKILKKISKLLLGGCTVLLTACYAPVIGPAMYAPPPLPKINRSISGHITYSADKTPVANALVQASCKYINTDLDPYVYCTITSKEGFYYVELERLPVDEDLVRDYEVNLYISNTKYAEKSVKATFTQEKQEEHIELNIELEDRENNETGGNGN